MDKPQRRLGHFCPTEQTHVISHEAWVSIAITRTILSRWLRSQDEDVVTGANGALRRTEWQTGT